jgi:hypothetical protein
MVWLITFLYWLAIVSLGIVALIWASELLARVLIAIRRRME